MRRALWSLCLSALAGCTDFDALLRDCDAGRGACQPTLVEADAGEVDAGHADAGPFDAGPGDVDAGPSDAGPSDAGQFDAGPVDAGGDACPGFTWQGFCWVNPTPMGEDLDALLYESDQDIWVGGAAGTIMHGAVTADGGHAWTSLKVEDVLSNGYQTGFVTSLLRVDGGVLAFGWYMAPHALQRGSFETWTAWPPLGGDPSMNTWAATTDNQGAFLAVGGTPADFAMSAWGDFWAVASSSPATPGVFTAIGTLPDGGFVKAFTNHSSSSPGTHHLFDAQDHELSLLTIGPSGSTDDNTFSLWNDPDGGLWYAGSQCSVGHGARETGPFTRVQPCGSASSILYAGTWSAAAQRHVLVGADGTIFEATSAQLTSTSLTTLFAPAVPSANHAFHSVTMLPDGGGLAVGEGAFIATRQAGGQVRWVAEDAFLRSNVNAVLALADGGVVAVGDDGVVVALPGDGARPTLLSPASLRQPLGNRFADVWSDGTLLYLPGDEGKVYALAPTSSTVSLLTSAGGAGVRLLGITGRSAADLTVVGSAGTVLRKSGTGAWTKQTVTQADGGHPDLYAVDDGVSKTWMAGGATEGQLYSMTPTGSVAHEVTTTFPVYGLRVAPSGTVWMVGADSRVARWSAVGSTLEEFDLPQLTGTRTVALSGLAVVSDTDLWAVGGQGVAYHWDGTAWSYVETGTRRDLYAAGLSSDGAGHRVLWLVGDFGTIIRKRL